MKVMSRTLTASVGVAAFVAGVSLVIADQGMTTGRVNNNKTSEGILEVKVSVPAGKTTKTETYKITYGVDTEAMIGNDLKIRATEIDKKWMVSVGWKQDADPRAVPKVKAGIEIKGSAAKNKNPMIAERIMVGVKDMTATFEGFDGGDRVKLTYMEQPKPSVGTKAMPKPVKRTVTASVHPKAKFTMDGADCERTDFKPGSEVRVSVIDDESKIPLISSMAGMKK